MQFPVIVIKPKDPSLYYFDKDNFGLASSGGEAFYKIGELYDSKGDKYEIVKINGTQKASFRKSLKYFQQMWIADLELKFIEAISLIDFKKLIIEHISAYDKYWTKRDIIKDLQSEVLQKKNYFDIIEFLK